MNNAPSVPGERFSAMTRLDHNRAKAQLARKAGAHIADVARMTIWGNHSATQYPDVFHAEIAGKPAFDAIGGDRGWLEHEFIPTVQQRGAAVIEARGLSSAASAANAAIEHVRDWALGSPAGDWVSMAVPSDGSYGVPEGLVSGFPCTTAGGDYQIVPGLDLDDFSRRRIDASVAELAGERDTVGRARPDLSGIGPGVPARPRARSGVRTCRFAAFRDAGSVGVPPQGVPGWPTSGSGWSCCPPAPCRRSGRWGSS